MAAVYKRIGEIEIKLYKRDPSKFWHSKRILATIFFIPALIIAIGIYNLKWSTGLTLVNLFPFILVLLIAAFMCRRQLLALKKIWSLYQVEFLDDSILYKEGVREFNIHRNEITVMEEQLGRGIFIQTENKYKAIFIPCDVIDYEEIKAILSTWKPIQEKQTAEYVRWGKNIGIMMMLLIAFRSDNKYLVVPMGAIMAIPISGSLLNYFNPKIPKFDKPKFPMFMSMLLVIVLILRIAAVLGVQLIQK